MNYKFLNINIVSTILPCKGFYENFQNLYDTDIPDDVYYAPGYSSFAYKYRGKWVAGPVPTTSHPERQSSAFAYLCYYNESATPKGNFFDRTGGSSYLWSTNKSLIGRAGQLPALFMKLNDGEYMPIPPVSGRIRIIVRNGFISMNHWYWNNRVRVQKTCRWLLFKELTLSVTDRYGNDINEDNITVESGVEVRETINAQAKEECEINTRVGTLAQPSPAAIGQFFNLNGQAVNSFTRNGKTGRLENLLINTIRANYTSRKNVLSGTVEMLSGFNIFSEKNTEGKFLLVSDVQRPMEHTSDIKMVEFYGDSIPVLSVSYDGLICQLDLDAPPPPPPTYTYTIVYTLYVCQSD
jgi:hypothetical protein